MNGRAFVTGASGFLGRHLLRALAARDVPVTALCRRPDTLADLRRPGLSVVAIDVRDSDEVAAHLTGVDTFFHLAAVRNGTGERAESMRDVNFHATVDLAERALGSGVRQFVHASTALVFGPSARPLDESSPLVETEAAAGAYVAGKARAVAALRRLRDRGAEISIVHPAIVYGPDHPSHPNRVTDRIRRILARRPEIVLAGGRVERDLVHVDDVIAALLAMADDPSRRPEVVAAGGPVSHRGLAELVARASGRPVPLLLSAPVNLTELVARIVDRLRGRDSHTGSARAVWTLARPWRFRTDGLRQLLGREPIPAGVGVGRTVEWLSRGRR
jgi:nucleoside-diphosphate-sugar epimerase